MHKFAYSCPAIFVCLVVACTGSNDSKSGTSDGEGGAGTGSEQASGGSGEGGQSSSGGTAGKTGGSSGGGGGSVAAGGTAGMNSGGAASTGGAGGAAGIAGKPGGTGGSPSTGGASGGVVSAECSKLTNCDTFESYNVSQNPGGAWTGFDLSSGSLSVDGTRGYGGSKKSVKVSVSPGGGTARMRHNGTGVLPADEVYMRMMVWIDAPPKGSGHWNWMWGEGNAGPQSGGKINDAFVASGGSLDSGRTWMLYGGGGGGGYQDCFSISQTKFPVGKWTCYEFHLDSKTNSGHSWIDGRLDEIVGFDNALPLVGQCLPGHNFTNGLWYVPKIDRAFFGFKMFHELTETATAWLDDIAISTKRIGCPAP